MVTAKGLLGESKFRRFLRKRESGIRNSRKTVAGRLCRLFDGQQDTGKKITKAGRHIVLAFDVVKQAGRPRDLNQSFSPRYS
jgi:hypothetical protein